MKRTQIAIIGGGHSGMTAAYHLSRYKESEIVILEAGRIGYGSDDMLAGSPGPRNPKHSKMILSSFVPHYNPLIKQPTLNAFIDLHGEERVADYIAGLMAGRDHLINFARKIVPSAVRVNGTIQVAATFSEARRIKNEMTVYKKRLDICPECKIISSSTIADYLKSNMYPFDGFIWPGDAIIAPNDYLTGIKNKLRQTNNVYILENTPVKHVKESIGSVRINTEQEEILADHVIFATNGFIHDENIGQAIGGNAWSFTLSFRDEGLDTPNINIIATLQESNSKQSGREEEGLYVTRQDNVLMVGGGDAMVTNNNSRFHYKEKEIIKKLIAISAKKFPRILDEKSGSPPVPEIHFGIYCFSLDGLPIVGRFKEGSRKLYLAACNGVGQGLLALGASLMPSLLGMEPLPPHLSRYAELMSPTRRTLKAACPR